MLKPVPVRVLVPVLEQVWMEALLLGLELAVAVQVDCCGMVPAELVEWMM